MEKKHPVRSVEVARQRAIHVVHLLKRENAPRINDTRWTSYSGYNYGRWADKGFDIVLALLQNTPGAAGELGPAFLRRICGLARQAGDDQRQDAEDEDSASSSAIDAAIWALMGLLPPAEPAVKSQPPSWQDPLPEVSWKLWYTDLFDRECPPSVELSGQGLAQGLKELWSRYLLEALSPAPGQGLSRFHLFSQRRSIKIEGDLAGAARLRRWLYGAQAGDRPLSLVAGGGRILHKISIVHARLLPDEAGGQPILDAAAAAADLLTFEAALDQLARSSQDQP